MTTPWKEIVGKETNEEAARHLYKMYQDGASSTELATALGVTDVTLRQFFKRFKLKLKQHGGLYEGKGCVITEEDYKDLTYKQLAKKYSVSEWTVWNKTKLFRGKKKKKLNPPPQKDPPCTA